MVSDVSRVLVVLVIILLAFSTALACVGTEQVPLGRRVDGRVKDAWAMQGR